MSKLWTSMVLAVLYSAQLCADTAPAPTIGGTLSVNSFNVEWESWVESALDLPPVIRVQRLRRSCISKFCLICIIPIAVHLMDLETENWYLFIDWKISPGSQLRPLSLSVRSLEYQFQYPRSCLEFSVSKSSIRRLVITEKAPTRAFSWLKAATTASHLRHYAKRALTPRSLNVKLGRWRNSHKGRAVWLVSYCRPSLVIIA